MQTKISVPQNALEIPEDILCPITQQIMTDPVILVESGHTYEREAILLHLKTKQTDPLTNVMITHAMIAPNHMAKKMIISFLEKHRVSHPHIEHEIYLPQSLVQNLMDALQKNNAKAFLEALSKDSRLLKGPLKGEKNLLMLGCELASLEILNIILEQLGKSIVTLPCVQRDKGRSLWFFAAQRLGLEGAKRLSKAFLWEAADIQALLNAALKENRIENVKIALSFTASILQTTYQADAAKQIELEKQQTEMKRQAQKIIEQEKSIKEQAVEIKNLKNALDVKNVQKTIQQTQTVDSSVKKEDIVLSEQSLYAIQAKQEPFINALLKGDLDQAKKLEAQGASLTESNREWMYPLVAAVYGMNLEAVRYIEGRLKKDEALLQWSAVDAEKAKSAIEKEMPAQLTEGATQGDLGNWYKNEGGEKNYCKAYDKACVEREKKDGWSDENWHHRASSLKSDNSQHKLLETQPTCMIDGTRRKRKKNKNYLMLMNPSAQVHREVVQKIRDQLNVLKKEVETKAVKRQDSEKDPHAIQKSQSSFIKALLEGDLDEAKKIECYGASLTEPSKEGLYPLVAAVYGMNVEAVMYIDNALKEKAALQWLLVDVAKVKREINYAMPQEVREGATWGDLSEWYKSEAGHPKANRFYDRACLKKYFATKWGHLDWVERGKHLRENFRKGGRWGEDCERLNWEQSFVTNQIILYFPSRVKHDAVVKQIRESFTELRQMVEAKTKPATTSPLENPTAIATNSNSSRFFSTSNNATVTSYPTTTTTTTTATTTTTSATPIKEPLTLEQEGLQQRLVAVLLKGDLVAAKKLELEGASFFYRSKEGLYPLVAAVYGTNIDAVKYIESKLNEEAKYQWSEVDVVKAKREIASETPRELSWYATNADLAAWYETGGGMNRKKAEYNRQCLQLLSNPDGNCKGWEDDDWTARSQSMKVQLKRSLDRFIIEDTGLYGLKLPNENGNYHKLLCPSRVEHHAAVKKIREQLNDLRKEVETKANPIATSQAEKTANSSVNASSFFKAENTATTTSTTTSTTTTNTTTTVTTMPVTSSHAEQVEAMSKSVQSNINPQDLSALLKWVTEGHLVKVEALLKKNPTLGLGTGTVKDRSDRTFTNMTALQYAVWALDAEMSELIIGYIGAHNTSIQLNALANEPSRYSGYGTSYDYTPLVTKTQTYVDNYNKWSHEQNCQYWHKEVRGEQRMCPAWLIYAWSEEGSDVAWTKKDANRKIKREYDKNRLDWWFRFTVNYNNEGDVQCSYVCRVGGKIRYIQSMQWKYADDNLAMECWRVVLFRLVYDSDCVSKLGKSRGETLQRLRANADSQLNQTTMGFGKGQ